MKPVFYLNIVFFTVKVRGQHARRTLTAFIWDGISTNKVETHQEV